MKRHAKALNAYQDVNVSSAVPYADGVQLIQMLFDGLIDSLSAAEGHLVRKSIKEKSGGVYRASNLIMGLQGSLDFEKGAELARNLSELYDYCLRRLIKANLYNDIEAVREVKGLMEEISSAWTLLPSLLKDQDAAMAS